MSENKKFRLLISCGGTGGHFNPGLGIAKYLNQRGDESMLLLGGKHAEAQMKISADAGIRAESFDYHRPGKNPLQMLKFLRSVFRGIRFSRKLIREFQPDALLIMGSSISLPAALGAWSMKKPIFLQDGNARVGKANRILSRLAKGLALSFPAVNSKTLHCPCELTGLPLRQALVDGGVLPKAEAIQKLNELFGSDFTADSPTLLVFGGSLGALKINSSFIMPQDEPEMKKLQVIHLTGPGKLEELTEQYKMFPGKYILREASGEMGVIYSAVDAVICRSGGSTVSELAFFGKYALLIPFPYAAEHHQDDNARYLASGGGAEILFDADCSIDKMQDFVRRFLADPEKFRTLGANSGKLAFPDAAGAVIRMIQKNIK